MKSKVDMLIKILVIGSLVIPACRLIGPSDTTPTVDVRETEQASKAATGKAGRNTEATKMAIAEATSNAEVTDTPIVEATQMATVTADSTDAIAIVTGDRRFGVVSIHKNGEILAAMTKTNATGGIVKVTGAIWRSSDGKPVVLYLGDDGLPSHAVAEGHLVTFSNYTDNTVDIAITAPDGTSKVQHGVPINSEHLHKLQSMLHPSTPRLASLIPQADDLSPRDAMQMAGIAFGVFSCAATFASGGTLTILFGVSCASTLVGIWIDLHPGTYSVVEGLGIGLNEIACGRGLGERDPIAVSDCAALIVDIAGKILDEAQGTEQQLVSMPTSTVRVSSCVSSPPGLVACYPFNGNANDESGNGNHGTVHGATLVADRMGNANSAYSFGGKNAYIKVNYSSSLSFPHDLTVAAWIKTTDDLGGIANEHNGSASGNFVFGLYGGRLRFGRSDSVYSKLHDDGTVNDNIWHFVAGVYDDTNNMVNYYVDGVLSQSYAETGSLPNGSIPLIIGDENNHSYAFSGVIDDVRLYNRALSASEIQALYDSGNASKGQ